MHDEQPAGTDPKKKSGAAGDRNEAAAQKKQTEEEAYRRSAEEKVARRWGVLSYLLPGIGLGNGDGGAEQQLPGAGAGGDGEADAGAAAGADDWGVEVDEMGFERLNDAGLLDDAAVEADADAIAADLGVNNEQNLLEDSPSAAFDEADEDGFYDDDFELEASNWDTQGVAGGTEDGRAARATASEPESSMRKESSSASSSSRTKSSRQSDSESEAEAEAKVSADSDSSLKSALASLTLKDLGFGVRQLRAFVRTLYEGDRHAERERWRAAHSRVYIKELSTFNEHSDSGLWPHFFSSRNHLAA